MRLKLLLRVLGATLIIVALLGVNGAIYYSSVPHYQQMGWALFCAVNAIWIGALGLIAFVVAESDEVALRQLDRDREGIAA